MKLYKSPSLDPAWNLALEETLLNTAEEAVFMLWRNDRSVIVGRNQNTLREIDRDFLDARGIKAVRRVTGGGAVFHDPGNVNYTFVIPFDNEPLSAEEAGRPLVAALCAMGPEFVFSGRNDILANGKKVSGVARTVRAGKLLHHGTLLFSVNMSDLTGALRVDPGKIAGKGIASIRARVGNIESLLTEKLTVEEFMEELFDKMLRTLDGESVPLPESVLQEAGRLADARYRTWEWNYGESPPYSHVKWARKDGGSLEVKLAVSRGGIIEKAAFEGDFIGLLPAAELSAALTGLCHRAEVIAAALAKYEINRYIEGYSAEDITALCI